MAFGIYIHWPFCQSKCPYCDFNSHVANIIDHSQWRKAYLQSLFHWYEKTKDRQVDTIFFGGGTPSLMEVETVQVILDFIKAHWGISEDCEITLEANPTSFETSKFEGFRFAGINRVSIGVQSFIAADLQFLGREHSPDQARSAILNAKQIFDRTSFDLIYARPKQSLEGWRSELSHALELQNGHLSLYQLTIEQGTAFYTRHARGEFRVPEQDMAADFYDVTQEVLENSGLPAYEVSNYACVGQESRHNLIYWHYDDYLGIGPGAHGRVTFDGIKFSTRDHRSPELWLQRVDKSGVGYDALGRISSFERFQECLMMGLRLREGVPYQRLSNNLGVNVFDVLDQNAVEQLIHQNILANDEESLRTTPQGLKCLNSVLGYLLSRCVVAQSPDHAG